MGKKNKPPVDEEVEGAPAQPPVERSEGGGKQGRKAFKGSTGYNYGEDYNFQGGRPPSKTDYDAMTQEQRDQIGLPTFADWKGAARNWRSGFKEGGGNFENQSNIANALRSSGANSWEDISKVLQSMGIVNSPDQGQALFRRLQGAFQGNIDPSGRYHKTGDGQWADVGTSDLGRRGIPGASGYSGGMSGIQAVLAGLAGGGKDEQGYFDRLVNAGDWTLDPASGQYFNDPGNDPSRRVWVDRNNLQVEGSGYKSTTDPSRGPTIDYSKIAPGQTIAQYLQGQHKTDQSMADYYKKAGEATPYVPGTSPGTTAPTAPVYNNPSGDQYTVPNPAMSTPSSYSSPSFGAWGVSSPITPGTRPQPNPMMGSAPTPRSRVMPRQQVRSNPNKPMPQDSPFRYRHGAL